MQRSLAGIAGALLMAAWALADAPVPPAAKSLAMATFSPARLAGHLENLKITECSGVAPSSVRDDLVWAINDSGNGPYVYALAPDGKDRGRIRIQDVENRDWEAIDTFVFQADPYLLIADSGDNNQHHRRYSMIIVKEPALSGDAFAPGTEVPLHRRIDFAYPDTSHDAEAVAVDAASATILILTKRDRLPLVFGLPLMPADTGEPFTAEKLGTVGPIPPPTAEDRLERWGAFRSQPTDMAMNPNGANIVVLTYKHAYLFAIDRGRSWSEVFETPPRIIRLPLPPKILPQREAVWFSRDGRSLMVTSEGSGASIYRVDVR